MTTALTDTELPHWYTVGSVETHLMLAYEGTSRTVINARVMWGNMQWLLRQLEINGGHRCFLV